MALLQLPARSSSLRAALFSAPFAARGRVAGALLALVLLPLSGCQVPDAVTVTPSFTTSAALVLRQPADIAVMPVEDATPGRTVSRHLDFLREETMRQLVDRKYTPLTANCVDTALRGSADAAAARATGGSILEPAVFQKLAGHSSEDAMLLLRIDHWDDSSMMTTKRVNFRCQAALVGNDGQQLWFGTLSGEVKAGGLGVSPRDRDKVSRSCGEMMIRQVLLCLPEHQPIQVQK